MNHHSEYNNDIEAAVEVMRRGGVIAYPTDTVWGIGCDAACAVAVHRIYEIKHRADSKALITLVADEDMLAGYIEGEIPQACLDYLRESDRPTTIVYPKGRNVASELLAEDGSIGIRITRDNYSNDLCRKLGGAVVSTSANISGEPAAKVYGDISKKILDSVDYVAFSCRDSVEALCPSRVVKLTEDGEIIVLRD